MKNFDHITKERIFNGAGRIFSAMFRMLTWQAAHGQDDGELILQAYNYGHLCSDEI